MTESIAENGNQTQARALLVYQSDKIIDSNHPLFNEIILYGQNLAEVHVFAFVQNLDFESSEISKLAENIFLYTLPGQDLFWDLDKIWRLIGNQIIWQKRLRVDYVLNFADGWPAWIGYFLAWKYHRKFFIGTNGEFVYLPKYKGRYILSYLLLRLAKGIIVPGEQIANALINHIKVASRKVAVVKKAIDISYLGQKSEPVQFTKIYPAHNFFLITQVSLASRREIDFVLRVFEKVVNRYTRVALIMLVPSEQLTSIKEIVSRYRNSSIYIKHTSQEILNNFAGANIFLSVTDNEDSASLIGALAVHTPVVATKTMIAQEIFANSRYQEFMIPVGEVEGFTQAVFKLIENQQLSNEYRLNSALLIKDLSLPTELGQIKSVLKNIENWEKEVV